MRLFFDENMGTRVPDALRSFGLPIEKHKDNFALGMADEVLLPEVGAREWTIVTYDKGMRTRENQRQAIVDHRVGCFILRKTGSLGLWATVRILAHNWDDIERIAAAQEPPFLYRLYMNNRPKAEDLTKLPVGVA